MRSVLFVLLVACGGSKSPTTVSTQTPAPDGSGSSQPMVAEPARTCAPADMQCTVKTFSGFVDQACACKDQACGDKVNKDLTAWGTEMAKSAPKDSKPDQATLDQMTALAQRYGECLTKLYGNTTPPPDPCGGGNPCGD